MVDEVEHAAIGPLEILEDQDGRSLLRDPLEEEAPGREERVATTGGGLLHPQEREQRRTDTLAFARVAHELSQGCCDALARGRLVIVLG